MRHVRKRMRIESKSILVLLWVATNVKVMQYLISYCELSFTACSVISVNC
jgi:hypothetical protein